MKRRELILASAVFLMPALGRAQTPCPPSQLSVAGGTSAATTPCPATSSGTYSTDFGTTENPLSEGGKWVNGKQVGVDWNNVQTTGGAAYASVVSGVLPASRYNDSVAHVSTSQLTFNANQYSQGVVTRAAGYSPSGQHEIELLLRFQITANNARGYEVLWGHAGNLAIVRWNGPLANYSSIFGGTNIGAAVEGDTLKAQIVGSTITVYKNGVQVATASDSMFATGQPGIGFWPVDSSTPTNYGWKSYEAGNL